MHTRTRTWLVRWQWIKTEFQMTELTYTYPYSMAIGMDSASKLSLPASRIAETKNEQRMTSKTGVGPEGSRQQRV